MTTQIQSSQRRDFLFMTMTVIGGALVLWVAYQLGELFWRTPFGQELLHLSYVAMAAGWANLQAFGQRQTQVMGLPLVHDTQAYWFMARAGGILAYLLLWFGALWGVMMTGKLTKGVVDASMAYGLHEFLTILALVFAAFHALILLGDTYIGFNLASLALPFTSSYEPIWTGLGTLAFYLSVALILSSYIRRRIGQKAWRAFHYFSYLAFGLVLTHGLMAGTDSQQPAMQWLYWLTGAMLLFATFYRVLISFQRKSPYAV